MKKLALAVAILLLIAYTTKEYDGNGKYGYEDGVKVPDICEKWEDLK